MSAAEQRRQTPDLEQVPFTPETRRKVRGRVRAFGYGIAFAFVCTQGLGLPVIFLHNMAFGLKLGIILGMFGVFLLLAAILGFRARPQWRDLQCGYLLRYEGPVKMKLFDGDPETAAECHIHFPSRYLTTSRAPFLKMVRRDDFADVLSYDATVEFTPLAGDVLMVKTREFGDVRA